MFFTSSILLSLLASFPAFASPVHGLRAEMTVLKGVLVRAGGPGGVRSLPDETLNTLCEQGFRTVFYLYPEDDFANPGPHACSSGVLNYKGNGFFPRQVGPIMQSVHAAALAGKGPVLVHCWNGSHASGEVAAYALMQFCGWSGSRAAEYWQQTVHDSENMSLYGSIVRRIQSFRPAPELNLPAEIQNNICP